MRDSRSLACNGNNQPAMVGVIRRDLQEAQMIANRLKSFTAFVFVPARCLEQSGFSCPGPAAGWRFGSSWRPAPPLEAQTATVTRDKEAAQHAGQDAMFEGDDCRTISDQE
jgi:hypothetical protein